MKHFIHVYMFTSNLITGFVFTFISNLNKGFYIIVDYVSFSVDCLWHMHCIVHDAHLFRDCE